MFVLKRANIACKQQMTTVTYLNNILNNFRIIQLQIGIIYGHNSYRQPNQVLFKYKQRKFSGDAVWYLQLCPACRFTMACC